MSLTVKRELEMEDLYDVLWGGAADRWKNATDEQRECVWETLIDIFQDNEVEIPDMTTINDFIWFECDDIFYDSEEEEEE